MELPLEKTSDLSKPILEQTGKDNADMIMIGLPGRIFLFINFIAESYYEQNPEIKKPGFRWIVNGEATCGSKKRLLIFNHCPPAKTMDKICKRLKSLSVYDNHGASLALSPEYTGYANIHINKDESMIMTAFKYFYPTSPVPLFVKYIQDGDMGKGELKGSKEVFSYLCSAMTREFKTLKSLLVKDGDFIKDDDVAYTTFIDKGRVILFSEKRTIDNAMRFAYTKSITLEEAHQQCQIPSESDDDKSDTGMPELPATKGCRTDDTCQHQSVEYCITNTSSFQHETCVKMLEKFPNCAIALVWWYNGKKEQYSYEAISRPNITEPESKVMYSKIMSHLCKGNSHGSFFNMHCSEPEAITLYKKRLTDAEIPNTKSLIRTGILKKKKKFQ